MGVFLTKGAKVFCLFFTKAGISLGRHEEGPNRLPVTCKHSVIFEIRDYFGVRGFMHVAYLRVITFLSLLSYACFCSMWHVCGHLCFHSNDISTDALPERRADWRRLCDCFLVDQGFPLCQSVTMPTLIHTDGWSDDVKCPALLPHNMLANRFFYFQPTELTEEEISLGYSSCLSWYLNNTHYFCRIWQTVTPPAFHWLYR